MDRSAPGGVRRSEPDVRITLAMRQYTYSHGRSRYEDPPPLGVRAGAILALAGVLVLFAGPVAYRFGWLSLRVAAGQVFIWGAYLGGFAALLSLLGLVAALRRRVGRRGIGRAVLAILVGAVAFRAGGRIPFVTPDAALADVTTDTANPPAYVAVPPLRGTAASDLAYQGEALAARQRAAYPDIEPLVLAAPKDRVFARAVAAVRDLGWTLVAADGPQGHIEASARTRLFGTVDDVVVRVVETEGGSRVDVRSVAREGDQAGTSPAARVREMLRALTAAS